MKYTFLVAFLSLIFAGSQAQNFQVGNISTSFTDSSRNNRNIPVEIYYPADTSGNNVPVTTSNTNSFPVLSFGHGFVMSWDAYENIWNAVVPQGYVIVFPKTEGGTSPSHSAFGEDLAFCIREMNRLSLEVTSPFYQRIDSMNCVMGHSMGGGAAFIAAGNHPYIKAIATLAAAETNPSAIQSATTITSPALVLSGGNDCITPTQAHQTPMYNSLSSACKSYISITGGSHCQMADFNFLCNFGELTCTPSPAISRADQHQVQFRYLLPWLDKELKFNCNSAIVFDSLLQQDSQITFQQACQPCNITGIENTFLPDEIQLYPNPAAVSIMISLNTTSKATTLEINDLNGRAIREYLLHDRVTNLDIAGLNNGYYTFTFYYDNSIIRRSVLILK
jgi:predicted dienelactone hydrolase